MRTICVALALYLMGAAWGQQPREQPSNERIFGVDLPTISNLNITPNPARIGDKVILTADVTGKGHLLDNVTANVTFGDGTPDVAITVDDLSGVKKNSVSHVYNEAGVFIILIRFSIPDIGVGPFDLDIPIFEVVGVPSVAIDQSTGANVIASFLAGNTVALSIDASNIPGVTTAVTSFEDASGAARAARSAQSGLNVTQQLGEPGLYVATSDLKNSSNANVGKLRKTVGIGRKAAGAPDGLLDPPSTEIRMKNTKGKFVFNGSSPDVLSFSGEFMLPPGYNRSRSDANTIQFSISNVIDTITFDTKGRAMPGVRGRIKKVQVKLPKLAGDAVGGELVRISVQYNVENLTGSGLDTEGITPRANNQSGAMLRQIQVNLFFAGVAYESLAPVNYVISKDGEFGRIASRN